MQFVIYLLYLFIFTSAVIFPYVVHSQFYAIRGCHSCGCICSACFISSSFSRAPTRTSTNFRVMLAMYAYARASTTQLYLFVCDANANAHGERTNTYVDILTYPRLVNCKIIVAFLSKTVTISEKSLRWYFIVLTHHIFFSFFLAHSLEFYFRTFSLYWCILRYTAAQRWWMRL